MTMLAGKRVLVAGATGNIGMHLVEAIVEAEGTAVPISRSETKLDALLGRYDAEKKARLMPLAGDIADEREGPSVVARAGHLDGAVVSIGDFVSAADGQVLQSTQEHLRRALDGSVLAHFAAARAILPALHQSNGSYLSIQGPLAYQPILPGTGLVSIATAAQAMLTRVIAGEVSPQYVRVNELVLYASLGWGDDEQSRISGKHIGSYAVYLLSNRGAHLSGQSIHLMTPNQVPEIQGQSGL